MSSRLINHKVRGDPSKIILNLQYEKSHNFSLSPWIKMNSFIMRDIISEYYLLTYNYFSVDEKYERMSEVKFKI